MKNLKLTYLLIFVFSLALFSCTKDFQCECTYKNEIMESKTLVWDITDQTQADAQEACENFSNPAWTQVNCKLK